MTISAQDTLPAARQRLAHIAFSRDSLLCREARHFSQARQDLFLATYMAMRVVDDHVDHLPADQRGRESLALAHIQRWHEAVGEAARGRALPLQAADRASPVERDIFALLAATMPRSDLGMRPFDALADAMRLDAQGRELLVFDDFLAYAEGATVAPTYIFNWLLACDPSATRLPLGLASERLWILSRPLAVRCYLAHIMRDLVKDAEAGPALLTLWRDLHEDLADNREDLAARICRNEPGVAEQIRARLFRSYSALEDDALAATAELAGFLDGEQLTVLSRILEHYNQQAHMSASTKCG